MFNRATNGTYSPGSTFKMVTGYAGLSSGYITRSTEIYDGGVFTTYADKDFEPTCWIYSSSGGGHGMLNIVGAIQNSCNVFFYTVGDNVGITALSNAAKLFGFGASTGIEIGDSEGVVATREYAEEVLGIGWYAADTVYAAIGQGYNLFTPVQLANYVSAIANGGTVNKLTLLNSVKSADYTETVFRNTPEILSEFSDVGKSYIDILQEGMEAVATDGSAYSVFRNYTVDGVEISVACKTGTVQSDTTDINNGVFVCYAPADDPEIAISVVVEKGGSGAEIMSIAKEILDYYFGSRMEYITVAEEGVLIP